MAISQETVGWLVGGYLILKILYKGGVCILTSNQWEILFSMCGGRPYHIYDQLSLCHSIWPGQWTLYSTVLHCGKYRKSNSTPKLHLIKITLIFPNLFWYKFQIQVFQFLILCSHFSHSTKKCCTLKLSLIAHSAFLFLPLPCEINDPHSSFSCKFSLSRTSSGWIN